MLKATVADGSRISCPLCLSAEFTVIRKVPGQTSIVLNQCRCESCGESFEFEEDREGHAINHD